MKATKNAANVKCLPVVRCWQHHLEELSIESHVGDRKELKKERVRKMRAKEDNNVKAFFQNA